MSQITSPNYRKAFILVTTLFFMWGLSYGLIDVLNKLVDRGNTVVVIEHNLDVVKVADWIIDIGPEGGAAGGRVLAAGTPHEVAAVEQSYTGRFLRQMGL